MSPDGGPASDDWKLIQKNVFTRWCNERLKVVQVTVEELQTDLSDGVRLILLVQVLSQKKVGRYNKKPRIHAQKMENVQLALDLLMKKEKIRLVNIGAFTQSLARLFIAVYKQTRNWLSHVAIHGTCRCQAKHGCVGRQEELNIHR